MTKHQDLTGRGAVHPFAFVQGTDPALDANNAVAARKAWIDTASGNALKIRNESNTSWINIVFGASQVSALFREIISVTDSLEFPGTVDGSTFTLLTHI